MSLSFNPLISIILPSLNVAPYISECMDSVVRQTLSNIEVICVDGGSTDGTLEILNKYAACDWRIKIMRSEVKSYGYQVNLGVAAARGKYIGIVETDDFISCDMYERLYSYVKDTRADFVKGGFLYTFGFEGERVEVPYLNNKCKDLYGKLIDLKANRKMGMYDLIHIWSGIYRRDFLLEKELWFHESPGASFQDTSFSVLVGLMADTCIYTDECSYHYRTDNINSSVKSDSKVECVRDEYTYIYAYLRKHSIDTIEVRSLVDRYKIVTYRWNYNRLLDEGRKQFTKAISEEMKEYLPGGVYADILDDKEREHIKVLTDSEYAYLDMQKELESDKVCQKILKNIAAGMQFIIVGAGTYFDLIHMMKRLTKKDFIIEVCDNNAALQGTEKNGYCIIGVEEAAQKYLNANWIVANQYHSSEIVEQLNRLGITSDRIYVINRAISNERLLELLRKP